MNVLVCFKAIPKLDMMSNEDWIVQQGLKIDTSFVQNDLNPFDESALEMALRLRDHSNSFGLPCHLTAITIGEEPLNRYLKKLNALKFDKAVRIHSSEDLRFSPEIVARLLSNFVSVRNCFDVIITGQQSSEGDNAMTPLLLSEYLCWPCISQVIEIKPDTLSSLYTKSEIGDAILGQKVKVPLILSVGNSPNSYLRNPTLKNIAAFGKRKIEVIDFRELVQGAVGKAFKVKSLKKIDNSRQGVIIEGNSPEEKARTLFESYIKDKI